MESSKAIKHKVIYSLLIAVGFFPYRLLNHASDHDYILKLNIDDWFPLLPIFVIPYIGYIPALIFTLVYFIWFRDNPRRTVISVLLCLSISYFVFLGFPTTVPRPPLETGDVFSRGLTCVYALDEPFNCFPSLHVSLTVLALLLWIYEFPNRVILLSTLAILIVISTLFVKQHYVLDVVSGIALG
jgi:membrane-associated phospholipid phosphatase